MMFRYGFLGASALVSLANPVAHALEPNGPAGQAEHVWNFDDVALSVMIADVATVTGYTFIVHPDARNKRITLASTRPLSARGIFEVFLSTLRVHGFTAVPSGKGIYRIVPEKSGVQQAGMSAPDGANSLLTEVFKLNNFSAQEAARIVRPIIDEQGTVIANRQSNTLVVVDYASNFDRLRSILDRIDKSDVSIETVRLDNVPASEMATILSSLFGQGEETSFGVGFRAIAAGVGNSIVLRGDEQSVARAMNIAAQMDEGEQSEDTLRVITLNNANAAEIVPILEQVSAAIAARSGLASEKTPSTIAHHEATNSLVISAPSETVLALEKVIADLDRRRAQVLVEAIIVEMSDDTARELGVQFLLSGTDNSDVPFVSTNFSRSAPNLLALSGALSGSAFDGSPFNNINTSADSAIQSAAISSLLGLEGLGFGIGGSSGKALFSAVLSAVESDSNSRILSKPFTMTLDNGTSSILVGQEVPISTGSTAGSDLVNIFRTTERKKIGVGLNVTPRIGADDTIRMDIEQSISSLAATLGTDAATDLIFNERSITTSVVADDGEIIVLGGLIQQQETVDLSKIPILGDAPLIGSLFRSKANSMTRTNLMVFIRPTIIKDREDARDVTLRNYRYVRAEQLLDEDTTQPASIDRFVSEVLGQDAVPK